jgi:predicted SnoaL-like aldol condensation-catalyzing enzyme
MKMNILHIVAEGDLVMVHVNIRDRDPSPEKDPKDRPQGVNGVDVFRFENGKAVEHWGYFK